MLNVAMSSAVSAASATLASELSARGWLDTLKGRVDNATDSITNGTSGVVNNALDPISDTITHTAYFLSFIAILMAGVFIYIALRLRGIEKRLTKAGVAKS